MNLHFIILLFSYLLMSNFSDIQHENVSICKDLKRKVLFIYCSLYFYCYCSIRTLTPQALFEVFILRINSNNLQMHKHTRTKRLSFYSDFSFMSSKYIKSAQGTLQFEKLGIKLIFLIVRFLHFLQIPSLSMICSNYNSYEYVKKMCEKHRNEMQSVTKRFF